MNLKKLNFLVLAFVLCFALSCATAAAGSCVYEVGGVKQCFDNATSDESTANFERGCKSTETGGPSGTYDATNRCTALSETALGGALNAKYCKGAEVSWIYKLADGDTDTVTHKFTGDTYPVGIATAIPSCSSGTLTDKPSS